MIRFACDTCREKLVVPERHAGRRGKCPNCGAVNRVPVKGEPGRSSTQTAAAAAKLPTDEQRAAGVESMSSAGLVPGESPTVPSSRSSPGLIERLLEKVARKPAPGSDEVLDLHDAGGIPRAVKVLFFVGILVLVPLAIGAAFVVLILLRVKLGN